MTRPMSRFDPAWSSKYKDKLGNPLILPIKENVHNFLCNVCNVVRNLTTMGEAAIESHMRSKEHQKNLEIYNRNQSLYQHVTVKSVVQLKKSAAAEATWAFHIMEHHHSLNSASCTSELFPLMFPGSVPAENFASKRNKTTAILTDVLKPFFDEKIAEEVSSLPYSVLVDSTSHGTEKLVPIIIRYFSLNGVKHALLGIHFLVHEDARTLTDAILTSLRNWDLLLENLIAYCGDNANVNFGGPNRLGEKNVFRMLKNEIGRELIGVGCGGHVIHNAACHGAYQLEVNVERFCLSIRAYFTASSIRWDKLKESCEFVKVPLVDLPSHTEIRWLTLKNDYCFIELIVDMRKFQRKLEVDQNNNYYGLATHGILLKIENEYGLQKREAIEAEFQINNSGFVESKPVYKIL
uniref:Uncharacterized protein n=1 Tax=Acrobeloides nanus TaxID=290746 RepID=A0A914CQ90_9BILA